MVQALTTPFKIFWSTGPWSDIGLFICYELGVCLFSMREREREREREVYATLADILWLFSSFFFFYLNSFLIVFLKICLHRILFT
jgi:hypothetical protein